MTPSLIDPFGRQIEYLRLSVTDRCDLRCSYCLPDGYRDFEEPAHWLTFPEIERVVRAFADLGVRRVRITGGEPLTRRDLPVLARSLRSLPGLEDLSLSTNAVQLGRHARALFDAGVRRINVSLDSLQAERYTHITGGGKLEKVLAGLEAARAAGFSPIKINVVAMAGVNDDEYENIVRFCIDRGFTLRFIETMPVGDTGRNAGGRFLDLRRVRERLERSFELVSATMPGGGPARYVKVKGTDLRIGFITPISQHFCETCNRVRLTASGTLLLCLGQEDAVELRPPLREGVSDGELRQILSDAIARKPERHEFREQPEKIVRFMSSTGG
jgi:cyclic pyranopterin phosphate synthase